MVLKAKHAWRGAGKKQDVAAFENKTASTLGLTGLLTGSDQSTLSPRF
jgi:hypothetical protein